MEYRFSIVEADRFVRVDAEGRVDMPASLRLAREASAFEAGKQLPILVDGRRLQGRLTILDITELVKAMAAEASRYRRKLAVLARADDQLERARFLELYSRNRGLPIRAFVDYEEAVRWLNDD